MIFFLNLHSIPSYEGTLSCRTQPATNTHSLLHNFFFIPTFHQDALPDHSQLSLLLTQTSQQLSPINLLDNSYFFHQEQPHTDKPTDQYHQLIGQFQLLPSGIATMVNLNILQPLTLFVFPCH